MNRSVEADIGFDKRTGGPNCLAQVLPRHHFAGVLQQQRQDPKRLLLKPDLDPLFEELARAKVDLEHAEPDDSSSGLLGTCHEVSYDDRSLMYSRSVSTVIICLPTS